MISTHSVCVMWPNYPGASVVRAALKFKKRKENLSSCVRVLHKTLNVVISRRCFAEDDKNVPNVPKFTTYVPRQCFVN